MRDIRGRYQVARVIVDGINDLPMAKRSTNFISLSTGIELCDFGGSLCAFDFEFASFGNEAGWLSMFSDGTLGLCLFCGSN